MTHHDAALDELIERLRKRAADPERRADVIVDAFSASVRTMDLGSLFGAGRSMAASLGQLLGEIRTSGMPSPGHFCVNVGTGRVLDWDPEDLRERSNEAAWRRSFSEVASSVEAWLDTWVGGRTQREQLAGEMARSQVAQAREARTQIAAMTPEARAAMGLPEVGWEAVVWGGIGLDRDEGGA